MRMHHDSTSIPKHEDRLVVDGRAYFLELYGVEAAQDRARAIARLPRVTWRGRILFRIRCNGDYGKGPHDMNVPESLLWNLISIHRFTCPYHSR